MFLEVERHVAFLIKNKIMPSQFLLLYLIYKDKNNLIQAYKNCFGVDGTSIGQGLIDDLMERKLLVKIDETKGMLIKNLKVSDIVSEMFIKDIVEVTEQIYREYPPFTLINGVNVPLLTMDTYEFGVAYSKMIDSSIDEHRQVIEDIRFGVKYNLIKMKIETFVRSRFWLSLRQMRLQNAQRVELKEENLNNF